jgi:disulfide bond formation protein DsbB
MTETHPKPETKTTSKQTLFNYFIFLQALVATLGSLYYSTFGDPVKNLMARNLFPMSGGFAPCELCWFARILMYPMVILSAVGLIKEDENLSDYILPLSILGIILDTYHYGLQKFNFPNPFKCTLSNPCTALQVQYFGFITIPFLALVAFIVITILAIMHRQARKKKAEK